MSKKYLLLFFFLNKQIISGSEITTNKNQTLKTIPKEIVHNHIAPFLTLKGLLIQSFLEKNGCNPDITKKSLNLCLKNLTYSSEELNIIQSLDQRYQSLILKKLKKQYEKAYEKANDTQTLGYKTSQNLSQPTLAQMFFLNNIIKLFAKVYVKDEYNTPLQPISCYKNILLKNLSYKEKEWYLLPDIKTSKEEETIKSISLTKQEKKDLGLIYYKYTTRNWKINPTLYYVLSFNWLK